MSQGRALQAEDFQVCDLADPCCPDHLFLCRNSDFPTVAQIPPYLQATQHLRPLGHFVFLVILEFSFF